MALSLSTNPRTVMGPLDFLVVPTAANPVFSVKKRSFDKFLLGCVPLCLALFSWAAGDVFGGTVITNNLPANTAILNVNGRQDGAAAYTGRYEYWFQPFYTSQYSPGATNFVEFTFQPGAYTLRVIDSTDAAQQFPALTADQVAQIFTGWTFNSPWTEAYLAFDVAAATNATLSQLFEGGIDTQSYSSATAAYDGLISHGFGDRLLAGADGQAGTNFFRVYSVASPKTLIFTVNDYGLWDNSGGVSILISPTDFYTMAWETVAGGAGTASGGGYSLSGTIGQTPAGGPLTNGIYSLTSGFWAVEDAIGPGSGGHRPVISPLGVGRSSFSFRFVTAPGLSYVIQQVSDLTSTNWIAVTNFPGDGSSVTFTTPPFSNRQNFYRVLVQ